MIFAGIVIILCGLFLLAACFFNWDWYFNVNKARMLIKLIGRTGARIVYGIFAVIFIIGGIAAMCGFMG